MKLAASIVLFASSTMAASDQPTPPSPPPGQRVIGMYIGTLPCADCGGIRTELTLFDPSPGASGPSSYWLKETYLGKPLKNATFESGGSWTTQTGMDDAKSTVYKLTEARSGESRFLLKVSDDELRMLDRSGRAISSKLDYSLKRQPASNLPRIQLSPPGQYLLGVYGGALSCAGCDGALLELSLFVRPAADGLSSYWLKETRPEGPSGPGTMESHGTWTFGGTWWPDQGSAFHSHALRLSSVDGRDALVLAEQRPDAFKLVERRGVKMPDGGVVLRRVAATSAGAWPESIGCERLGRGGGIDSAVGTIRCANTLIHYDKGDSCAGKVAADLHSVDGAPMKMCASDGGQRDGGGRIVVSLPDQVANFSIASSAPQDTMVLLAVARNTAVVLKAKRYGR